MRHLVGAEYEVAQGASVAPDGDVLTVSTEGVDWPYAVGGGDGLRLVVRRWSPAGALRWERAFAVERSPLQPPELESRSVTGRVAATAESIFLAGVVRGKASFGPHVLVDTTYVVRLDGDGVPLWAQQLEATDVTALAADGEGAALLALATEKPRPPTDPCVAREAMVQKVGADGGTRWRHGLGGTQCDGHQAWARGIAAAPGGRVVVGGVFSGTLRFGESTFTAPVELTSAGFLAALEEDGTLAWFRQLGDVRARVTGVGVDAQGQVAASAELQGSARQPGVLRWGGDSVRGSASETVGALLVADAEGRPRLARALGAVEQTTLAVDPSVGVLVTGLSRSLGRDAQDPRIFATLHGWDGERRWTRGFVRREGPRDLYADGAAAAVMLAEGGAVLFGQFSHPNDFGTGVLTPTLTDVFLLRLAP